MCVCVCVCVCVVTEDHALLLHRPMFARANRIHNDKQQHSCRTVSVVYVSDESGRVNTKVGRRVVFTCRG